MTKIEICCDSINSLKKSVDMGVSRIELCSELSVGGLTPSYGFIKEALKYSKDIPIRVLIRPRAGDFHYNNFDIEIMKNDIYEVKKLGVEGVVLGIVDNKGELPITKIADIVDSANGLSMTFHRAFDLLKNPKIQIDNIIELGFDTILSSGKQEKAIDGLIYLNRLKKYADNKIFVMPGAGINHKNTAKFIQNGFKWIHMSAKKKRDLNKKNKNIFLDQEICELDENILKKVMKLIKTKV